MYGQRLMIVAYPRLWIRRMVGMDSRVHWDYTDHLGRFHKVGRYDLNGIKEFLRKAYPRCEISVSQFRRSSYTW